MNAKSCHDCKVVTAWLVVVNAGRKSGTCTIRPVFSVRVSNRREVTPLFVRCGACSGEEQMQTAQEWAMGGLFLLVSAGGRTRLG